MESYKQEFIEFMVESDVLKFGEFTLKSGRKSPFFMNAGAYVTGSQLKKLGQSMIPMEMISMCCSDLHTRESRLEWSRQLLTVIFTEKKYAIVLTVKKKKIMVPIKEAFSEAS